MFQTEFIVQPAMLWNEQINNEPHHFEYVFLRFFLLMFILFYYFLFYFTIIQHYHQEIFFFYHENAHGLQLFKCNHKCSWHQCILSCNISSRREKKTYFILKFLVCKNKHDWKIVSIVLIQLYAWLNGKNWNYHVCSVIFLTSLVQFYFFFFSFRLLSPSSTTLYVWNFYKY